MPLRNKRRVRNLVVVSGFLLIAIAIIYSAGQSSFFDSSMDRQNWPAQFQSNGERIYFTATSSSGSPITLTGGGMHMQMHSVGCVTCHGVDRRGGRSMSSFWTAAPPLTPAALFKEHDDGSSDDGHGDHDGYDDATLRRAITEGLDPDGKQFDPVMPRWSMSEQDLADLITFLNSPVAD